MSNQLQTEKKITAVAMLAEGNSIRSIERMTGVHRDTIMRLGVRMGEGCQRIMDEKMRNLPCRVLQVDEIWGFVQMKEKTAKVKRPNTEAGDVWTWIALDAETKLVPAFAIGDRTQYMANDFIEDLAARLSNRVQISTDGLAAYRGAVERAFGCEVDYGSIIKTFGDAQVAEQRRYSPPEMVRVDKKIVQGEPVVELISTSYVEKAEPHPADALPPPFPTHKRLFQKARELQGGCCAPLRLLQFCEDSQNDSLRARCGGWRHQFRLDGSRSRGNGGVMSERVDKIKDAIETMHGCTARHAASEPVIELFRGEVVWDGVVETFELGGHPKAKRCYAWSYPESGETQYVTVLELPPVDSAENAVKVAVASKARANAE